MRFHVLRVAALLAIAALGACAGPGSGRRPGDLLTDVGDDGSLLTGALSPDPLARAVAISALANLPPVAGAELLVERAHIEQDEEVLLALCFLFGRWQQSSAISVLESLSVHSSAKVRAASLDALSRLAHDELSSRLIIGLSDPEPSVRGSACLALARLDSARDPRPRSAPDSILLKRDEALAAAALNDPDRGVRWRAVWALGWIRPRPGFATIFRETLGDDEALVRLFAVRGLGRSANPDADALLATLDDPDPRVELEAAAALARATPELGLDRRLGHARPVVRALAAEGLRRGDGPLDTETEERLRALVQDDPSAHVRREARATLAVRGSEVVASAARAGLLLDEDPRARALLAGLLANGSAQDPEALKALLADEAAPVRAEAVRTLASGDLRNRRGALLEALSEEDVAVRGSLAEACAELVDSGRAPAWLVSALADALSGLDDPGQEETRVALAKALGLPELDPIPPTGAAPEGRLLQRLLDERQVALEDRLVRVRLSTSRGDVELELDRLLAPKHVASFLELVRARFYDGLDLHRVVPNFVVQGLDPRGDGWGTGGRRLPDEFTPSPYLTGTVGMPRTSSRHTGGCQLFITHLPTPHLDGEYTVMGRVVSGMDLVQQFEVGDVVESVRRL